MPRADDSAGPCTLAMSGVSVRYTVRRRSNLAAYLVSDGAGYITGEVVTVDGVEWLGNAGQFNLMRSMSEADWDAFRAKQKRE